ncbi:hypothetical protein HMPREF3156_00552 [Neisseria sp. HMSC06F02]|nr:hypothetical protein HMPREF3156_00552 [Neisseria sp. HMSC06F02]
MFDGDFRPHGFEAFEVLVDRARTDGAAAGQADLGFAETRQRRAEHEDGGTHGFHQFVGGAGVVDGAAVDFEFVNVVGQNARAHALQQFLGGFDVGEHGYVFQAQGAGGQESGAHQRQGGVFRAGYGDFAVERAVGGDFEFVHSVSFVVKTSPVGGCRQDGVRLGSEL